MRKATVIMYTNRTISTQYRPQLPRIGFTLVELMIVIAVILLLMTITITAFANFIVTSKEAATAATISKINKIITQRKEAFDRMSFKAAARRMIGLNFSALPIPFSPPPSSSTAEIILRKQRFQMAFPQRVEDRSIFNGIDYKPWFTNISPRPDYESSALLYLSITEGETFGAAQVDDDAFTAAEVKIVAANIGGSNVDIKYFVDAWGLPLRFYRWPTSLIKPTPGTSSPMNFLAQSPVLDYSQILMPNVPSATFNQDPDDPSQRLTIYLSSMTNAQISSFRTSFNLYFAEGTFHAPLVVSAGPDRDTGLLEPNDGNTATYNSSPWNSLACPKSSSSTAMMFDNITNHNQRNKGN
jgi:prepilin-type N-terminal cleavage/methylation domain-containing protein